MIKRKLKINKWKLIIILVVLNLLILGVGTTLASYISEASGETTVQVAKIVFNNNEVNSLSIDLSNMVPGTTKNIAFNVSNYRGGVRSDVTINYKLIVKSYGLIPNAQVVIKNSSTNATVLTCNSTTGTRDDNGLFICESSTMEMAYNANKMDSYNAEVSILNSNTSSSYAGVSDYVEIVIDSWQKQS